MMGAAVGGLVHLCKDRLAPLAVRGVQCYMEATSAWDKYKNRLPPSRAGKIADIQLRTDPWMNVVAVDFSCCYKKPSSGKSYHDIAENNKC